MSGEVKIPAAGELFSVNEVMRMANVAAGGDDRAYETIFTPGANQKQVIPLSAESSTVNPVLLVVGHDVDSGVPNGSVRLYPAEFIVGVSGSANSVAMSAKNASNQDSPTFGNNSSGLTRYDLLYAKVSFSPTNITKQQKPVTGGIPSAQTLTVFADPVVTLGIVANVSSSTPLASLPADVPPAATLFVPNLPGSTTVAGSTSPGQGYSPPTYYVGLAMVAIPNGYAGTAINQSTITQLWSGGWIPERRSRGVTPVSLYYGAGAEKPTSALTSMVQGAERWGGLRKFFAHFKLVSSTPTTSGTQDSGDVLDNTIDWRHRLVWGFVMYLGSGSLLPLETDANQTCTAMGSTTSSAFSGGGAGWFGMFTGSGTIGSGQLLGVAYSSGASNGTVYFTIKSNGNLLVSRNTLLDPANGDALAVLMFATDQLINGI